MKYNWDSHLYKWWEHLLAGWIHNVHPRVIYGKRIIKVPFTTA